MALYNLSLLTEAANVGGVATAANTYSDGILFGMGSLVFFFIMMLALKRSNEFDEALLVSCLISFIISSIMVFGDFVNIIFPLAYLILTAFTALYMWAVKSSPY